MATHQGRDPTTVTTVVLGALASIAVIAFSVAFARAAQQGADDARAAEIDRASTTTAIAVLDRFDAIVDQTLARARARARTGGTREPPPAAIDGVLATTTVDVGEDGRRAVGELGPLGDPLDHREVAATLDLARDSGAPVLSAPVTAGDRSTPVLAVAVYELADGSSSIEPDVAGTRRRDTVTAWTVAAVDSDALMANGTRLAGRGDVAVELADGRVRLAASGDNGDFAPHTAEIPVLDRTWTVTVASATAPSPPGTAWLSLGVGALLTAAIVSATLVAVRAQRRLLAERTRATEQLRVISEIAPVVQQSLDLAVVLPAAFVRIVEELDLAGISCSVVGDTGRAVDVFSFGATVDPDEPPQLAVPPEVDADRTIAISLERGSRSVGVLRVRTGRPLDGDQLVPLAAVAELTTAAIINARLFEEQRETVERLQEIDELKTVFLGTASHELRTPVAAISGFAHLLSTRWDSMEPERRQALAERIAANSVALDGLVSDLLDFARLERGSLRAAVEPMVLSDIVAEVLARIESTYLDHRIVADIEPGVSVVGDPSGLDRVTVNLVSNAVKFGPADSTIHVTVRAVRDGRAELIVDDEGPGVPEAERERIFSRFYRGAGAEVVRTRGTGIGLSVVAEFCKQMDADISVSESPAGGARFLIRFPPPDRPSSGPHDATAADERTTLTGSQQ